MNKNWTKLEKSIGLLQIILGIITISFTIWAINNNLQLLIEYSNYAWEDISLLKIAKDNHPSILLGFLAILSGILLFRNNLIGWITSVSTWLIYGLTFIMMTLKVVVNKTNILVSNLDYIIIGFITSLCFILALLISSKQFRLKYSPTYKSWLIVGLTNLIFITDKFIFN